MRRLVGSGAIWWALGGCGTVVPMQTASVVDPGGLRVGGAVSAGFCDIGSSFACNTYPDGVPLPALRVDARKGVGWRSDVGGSLQLQEMLYAPERPLQLGLTIEGKRELVHSGVHVLSVGALIGGGIAGRLGLAPWLQTELGVPVFYGLQTGRFEWVASIWGAYRALFPSVGGAQNLPTFDAVRFGVGLGLLRRAPAGWAVMLGYDTDPDPLFGGALQARFGWFWDFPGRRP